MLTRTMRSVAIVAIAGLALAACSSNSDSSSSSPAAGSGGSTSSAPIKLLVSGAASGALAPNASVSINSAKAAANEINAAGGINGRQIEVTVVDDNADATTAVTVLQKAIADNKPDVFMNSGPSTVAAATLPVLTENKILSFNLGPTADSGNPKTNPFNFDTAQTTSTIVNGIAAAVKEEGFTNVGLLHGNSAYGEAFSAAAAKSFGDAGLTLVANEEYDTTALDMTPQIEAVKAKNPDVLVLDAYGAPLGYILKNIEKLGWDVPIRGNTSVSATKLISTPAPDGVLGTDQVKNLKTQVFESAVYNPANDRVNKAIASMKAVGPIQSTVIVALNYDAVYLFKAAVEKAGSTDSTAVAKALEDPSVTGSADVAFLPEYNFSAETHSPNSNSTKNYYTFIPAAPVQDGQFRPEGGAAGSGSADASTAPSSN